MRHPLVPALLVVLALLGYAIVGSMVAGATALSPNTTITGTVTDEDGRAAAGAYVLVEPADGDLLVEYTDGDEAVVESVLKLAAADSDGVTVVRTDENGRFSATVPDGRYRVAAVTRERITPLREVDAAGGAAVDLVVDRHRVLHVDAGTGGPVAPGNATTVAIQVANPDDDAVRSLTVTVGDLPSGWTLAGVETDGRYDADAGRIIWDRVDPNETAVARLQVQVPDATERGHHHVALTASSESHYVEQFDDGTVVVRPANATPTPTVHPGDLGGTGTPGGGNGSTPTPSPHVDGNQTVPGFGVGAALGGLAVVLALAARR